MCWAACAVLKKIGKLNKVTDVLEKELPFKSSEGFKLNIPVQKKKTLTHCSGKI